MTRAKISEYSATAGDNTDVNGVNIAEGCPPSGINDAIREVMGALKRFETGSDGDSVTVGGNLVVSGSTTANTLSTTVLQSDIISEKTSAAGVTVDGVLLKDSGVVTGAGTVSAPVYSTTGDTNTGIFFPAADTIAFAEGGAEAMRINSSGNVGIGTSSPASVRLTLNAASGAANGIEIQNSGDSNRGGQIWASGSSASGNFNIASTSSGYGITFNTDVTTERARITSGGYFKASDNGSYNNSTGSYHEFNNSTNNIGLLNRVTNASFGSNNALYYGSAAPSASSGYRLLELNSNAGSDIEFNLRGDGNGYADGTWNNNGADYAEFFESANGQALTLGATVVLDGNKVREATSQDPASAIIGVVRPKEPSKASMVVGNTAWNKWANKYLTDDFDRYIMEDHDVVEWEEQVLEREATEAVEAVVDEEGLEVSPAVPAQEAVYKTVQHSYESHAIPAGVSVPEDATRKTHDDKGNKFQHYKLNPAWNPDSEYVNRENRPEWNIIGLLGQVKILKGQPVGDRWIKMRDVSETVEEWMIR